jgi:hypothetical protein
MEKTLIPFNGRFTIENTNPEKQGHKTFKIKTPKSGSLKGKRILSLFTGTENTDDNQYMGFAFVTDDRINLWARFSRDNNSAVYIAMLTSMIAEGEQSRFYKMGYRLLMETKCRVCNRPLTNPESIKSGIGPECANR